MHILDLLEMPPADNFLGDHPKLSGFGVQGLGEKNSRTSSMWSRMLRSMVRPLV